MLRWDITADNPYFIVSYIYISKLCLYFMKLNSLSKDELDAIDKIIPPMDINVLKMKVGDIIKCITDEKSFEDYVESLDYTIFDKIGFVKGFIAQINALFKSLEQYNNDVPIEYQTALLGVKGLSTPEAILVDCIKYYNLHSTEQAEQLPFFDWYVMKRDEIISGAVQRKYEKVVIDKQHREAKRR